MTINRKALVDIFGEDIVACSCMLQRLSIYTMFMSAPIGLFHFNIHFPTSNDQPTSATGAILEGVSRPETTKLVCQRGCDMIYLVG